MVDGVKFMNDVVKANKNVLIEGKLISIFRP